MINATNVTSLAATTSLRALVESRGFGHVVTAIKVQAEAVVAHDEREALSRRIELPTDEIRQMRKSMRRA